MRRLLCWLDRHRVVQIVTWMGWECIDCPFQVTDLELYQLGPWHALRRP